MSRLIPALLGCLLLTGSPGWATDNVVVVLDDSGSMNDAMAHQRVTRMVAAKDALLKVLEVLPDETHVGIVLLNGRVNGDPWVVPLGPVDLPRVRALLDKIRAGGGTPLGQFLKVGADGLLQRRDRDHYGTYRLLVVTDGEASDKRKLARYLPDILSRGLTVDVIGVDMSGKHSLATKVHSYRQADNPKSLARAISEVFAETSSDRSDTGESDFDLLEAFPTELAVAALDALAAGGNQEIGTADVGTESSPNDQSSAGGKKVKDSGSSFSVVFFVLGVVILLNVVGKIVRRKRR